METCICQTTGKLGFATLSPEGWFADGHGFGYFLWAPAPAAVEVVVEQLGKARLKRPEAVHVIIVPKLMTGRWRRHLGRGTDGNFTIKNCKDAWEILAQSEPLLIFVCLPYVSHRPRLEERQELLVTFQGALPGKDMPDISSGEQGRLLRELLVSARSFAPCLGAGCPQCFKPTRITDFPIALQCDDEGEVIISGDEAKRFREARAGDHLMTPFQCNVCHFRNVYLRDPQGGDLVDAEVIEYMRRVILDSLWSREPSTGRSNLQQEAKRGARTARRFRFLYDKRVGEIRRQDEALTIDVLHGVDKILESRWKESSDQRVRRRVAEMGTWFTGGFCTGLRGEEMVRIEFAGMAKTVDKYVGLVLEPHFMFVVTGRSKGNQLSGAKFSVPCVGTTEGTHLRPVCWVKRLVESLRSVGIRSGRLFQQKLNPPRMCKWEDDFMTLFEQVQASTDLIEKTVDIRDVYGIGRTTTRGAMAHARNMQVDVDLIKAVQR
jgi:hypothetical protein